MSIYAKQSLDLVMDLINQSNPGLTTPVSASNVKLGTPAAIAVVAPSIADTSIRVTALPNQFYIGNTTLKYRRINLANLFKNMSLEIRKYSAAAANVSPYTLYQLLADINAKYGLSLTQDDFTDASFPAASDGFYSDRTSKVTLVTKATSLAYTGQIDIRWVYDKPLLANLISTPDIPGRLYPGGNTFDSNHKYVTNSEMFGIDASDQSAILNGAAFATGILVGNTTYVSQHKTVLDFLNNLTGKTYAAEAATAGQPFNINGATITRYTLPDATVPQANSQYYNRLVLITLPDTNPWGVGKIYIHFNV